jgi:hypothetical protein
MYWKKRIRKSSGWTRRRCISTGCVALLTLCGAAAGLDRLADLQARFDKETHAGSKIKIMERLTDAQFDVERKAIGASDFSTVGLTLEKYRDNLRACLELLKKQDPDVDRHSNGYRQLELQMRRGIREVEDTMQVAPPEVQPPLKIVHKDLLDMDDELIRLLFPRRTPEPQKVPPAPEVKP